jgi:hypothetical protein
MKSNFSEIWSILWIYKRTSWSRKLIKPVAITGFPIQTYQANQCCSSHESEENSIPEYASANGLTVEFP